MGVVRKISLEAIAVLPETWSEIRLAGGGTRVLAEALGCSTERARQLIRIHNLPKVRSWKEKSEIFLEELEFLFDAGEGVHAIAKALRMTPDSLVGKVNKLHYAGKTKVVFRGYLDYADYTDEREAIAA